MIWIVISEICWSFYRKDFDYITHPLYFHIYSNKHFVQIFKYWNNQIEKSLRNTYNWLHIYFTKKHTQWKRKKRSFYLTKCARCVKNQIKIKIDVGEHLVDDKYIGCEMSLLWLANNLLTVPHCRNFWLFIPKCNFGRLLFHQCFFNPLRVFFFKCV